MNGHITTYIIIKYLLIYWQKVGFFYESAINQKISAPWPNVFGRYEYLSASLYITTSVLNECRSHTNNVQDTPYFFY